MLFAVLLHDGLTHE